MTNQPGDGFLHFGLGHVRLGLQRAEERLHMGVVVAVGATAHALGQPAPAYKRFEVVGSVFDALIRMEQRSRARPVPFSGIAQGITGQLRGARLGRRPTKDLTGVLVHDHGEKRPASPGMNVGVIAHPDISLSRCWATIKQMIRHLVLCGAPGPWPKPTRLLRNQAILAHQPGDA